MDKDKDAGHVTEVELTEDALEEIAAQAARKAIEAVEARETERREAEEKEAEIRAEIEEKVRAELEDHTPNYRASFAVNKTRGASDPDEYARAVRAAMGIYLKTGNKRPGRALGLQEETLGDLDDQIVNFEDPDIRAAFQEDTGSEGGFLVPNDFFPGIVEKRDQVSWIRQIGVTPIQTSRDIIDIPAENAKEGTFAITSEEAAYDTDAGPSFSNVQVTVYKFTRTHRVSEELEEDEAVGFPAYLQSSLGRAWGLTENQYVAIGTGSSQPQGVMVGADTDDIYSIGTDGVMSSSDIAGLFYQLPQQYRREAEVAWLMNESTEETLVGRVSANAPEISAPLLNMARSAEDGGAARLMGFRSFNDSNVAELGTASNFVALFGNFNFYALVERSGLVIVRNPWLYMANGQVGFFAKARWGGAVLQDEAFKVAQQAA